MSGIKRFFAIVLTAAFLLCTGCSSEKQETDTLAAGD
jgi:hypothetical protein